MKTFLDTKGRSWELAVNCDTIEAVKAACDANVLDLLDPESDLMQEVTGFPPVIAKLLFAAVTDQAVIKGVDDREFRRSMAGDALADAFDALREELISFCPKHRRRVAAAVLEKNRDVEEAAADLALAKLADPELKAKLLEALETNLRREMETALERLSGTGGGPIASSSAAGTPPDCSAFPDPDLTPGGT